MVDSSVRPPGAEYNTDRTHHDAATNRRQAFATVSPPRQEAKRMTILRTALSITCAVALATAMVLLGMAHSLSHTLFDADFVIGHMDAVPVQDFFADQARQLVPAGGEFLLPLIDEAAIDLEPWARQQVALVIRAVERFLGGAETIRALISMEEPKRYLAAQLEDLFMGDSLPGLNQVDAQMRRAFLSQILQEVDRRIPDTVEITEDFFDASTMSSLQSGRTCAAYMHMGLKLLPILAALLALFIAWLQAWHGRRIAVFIAATFLAAAMGSLLVRSLVPGAVAGMVTAGGLPAQLTSALPLFLERCFALMGLYSVVLVIGGAALLIISLLLRSHTAS